MITIYSGDGAYSYQDEAHARCAGWGTMRDLWPEMTDERLLAALTDEMAPFVRSLATGTLVASVAAAFGYAVTEFMRKYGTRETRPAPHAFGAWMDPIAHQVNLVIKREVST